MIIKIILNILQQVQIVEYICINETNCTIITEACVVIRGSSAAMLFESCSRTDRLQRCCEDANRADDDSQSMYDNIEKR